LKSQGPFLLKTDNRAPCRNRSVALSAISTVRNAPGGGGSLWLPAIGPRPTDQPNRRELARRGLVRLGHQRSRRTHSTAIDDPLQEADPQPAAGGVRGSGALRNRRVAVRRPTERSQTRSRGRSSSAHSSRQSRSKHRNKVALQARVVLNAIENNPAARIPLRSAAAGAATSRRSSRTCGWVTVTARSCSWTPILRHSTSPAGALIGSAIAATSSRVQCPERSASSERRVHSTGGSGRSVRHLSDA
jgi:hypothetical protein